MGHSMYSMLRLVHSIFHLHLLGAKGESESWRRCCARHLYGVEGTPGPEKVKCVFMELDFRYNRPTVTSVVAPRRIRVLSTCKAKGQDGPRVAPPISLDCERQPRSIYDISVPIEHGSSSAGLGYCSLSIGGPSAAA